VAFYRSQGHRVSQLRQWAALDAAQARARAPALSLSPRSSSGRQPRSSRPAAASP